MKKFKALFFILLFIFISSSNASENNNNSNNNKVQNNAIKWHTILLDHDVDEKYIQFLLYTECINSYSSNGEGYSQGEMDTLHRICLNAIQNLITDKKERKNK